MNACRLFVAGALAVALACPVFAGEAAQEDPLTALVNSMPNCDRDGKYTGPAAEVALDAVQTILKGGEKNILALVNMLKEPDKGEDYKAHYLLHATATHAKRPGAEEERQLVAATLAGTLGEDRPTIIKAHVLEELKWIGGDESVPAVSKLLTHPELYADAAAVVENVRKPEPLRAALPKASSRNRASLIQALGRLRDADAVAMLLKEAESADAMVRLAALEALANIGDPRAVDVVLKAAKLEQNTYEEMKAAEAALRLAQRLVEADKKDDARRIYVALPKQCPGKPGRHIRIASLRGLAAISGPEIITDLIAALNDPDLQVRAEAARTATHLPGGAMVDQWLERLDKSPAEQRAGILFVLGAIGDPKAMPAVLKALQSSELAIRVDAMRAAASIGGQVAAEALVARMLACGGEEQQAALDSLTQARGNEASAVVAAAFEKASDAALKSKLLDVLVARRAGDQMAVFVAAAQDKDAAVRSAAARALEILGTHKEAPALIRIIRAADDKNELRNAERALLAIGQRSRDQVARLVVPALEGATGDAAAALFRVLGKVGGREAAKALTTFAASPDAKVSEDAVRALSSWSDSNGLNEAADGLLQIASTAKDEKRHVLALRGYIELANSDHWRRNTTQRLKIYGQALEIAKRPDEKRAALGGISNIQEPQALRLAAECLDDKDVAEEAVTAVVEIAKRLKNKTAPDVQAALAKAVEVTKNPRAQKEAARMLIKKPEPKMP